MFFCLEKNKYGSSCDVSNDECNILLDLKCVNSKCVCSNLTYWNGNECGKKYKKIKVLTTGVKREDEICLFYVKKGKT